MGTKRRRGVNPDGATILPDQPDALPSSNFHDARMAGNGPGNLCAVAGYAKWELKSLAWTGDSR
jgi:hypothetical protein